METHYPESKSFIKTLLELNEEANGKQKIFVFSLLKEERLENQTKQTHKCTFVVAPDYDSAVNTMAMFQPQFKDFRIVDHAIAHLGLNPEKVSPPPSDSALESTEEQVPVTIDKITKVTNLFRLLIEDYTEGFEEVAVLNKMLIRIKDSHEQRNESTGTHGYIESDESGEPDGTKPIPES